MSLTIDVSPSDMLLFAAVVREGSFTRAARRAGVTKQTVSERVARLEARLGVRLLERTTRQVHPTDAGAIYYERCAAIAAQIDEANATVRERQAEPVGLLRVSAPVLYGRRYLAPVVAEFLHRHPKARVEIVLADRRVNLVEEGFHLAIRIGDLDDSALRALRLGDGYVYYVAAPAFLAQHGPPTRSTLPTARCIGMRPLETWTVGKADVKIAPILIANDLEVACSAAAAGVGIARVPSIVCRDLVLKGRLKIVFPEELPRPQPVHVVYPSRQFLPAKVRLFIDALASLVEPMAPLATAEQPAHERTGPRPRRRRS